MNRNEVLHVLSDLQNTFSGAYQKIDKNSSEALVQRWLKEFESYDADQVIAAVNAFISEERRGFPPSIGQIKAKLPVSRNKTLNGIDRLLWERQKRMIDRFQELKKERIAAGIPADYLDARSKGMNILDYVVLLDQTGLWGDEIL